MNFVEKIFQQDGGPIRFIKAKEKGKDCWFLISLNPETYKEYKLKMLVGNLNIRDYGEIIYSGWGRPSKEMIKKILDEFGIDLKSEFSDQK